ncbi:heavy metal translocating P-type ATPase [Mycolicibacterium conceptionense]|uniref:Heavy metal translocating P-type ATPase n=1 Tax=Mycolicibacterium conceptionense TaxID=451644 RepID=A0A0U1DYL0_9MYCO|nr:heavy metal translocating P-type ATPase [Mycolicibacterium conceptionense]
MSDACCGPQDDTEPQAGPEKLWQVRELQLAALSAVLLLAGWLVARAGYESWSLAIELVAVLAAASTFVPDALRNLRHGRIGVGTLMTIAAVGAVALGQIAEAALLGILFSIAEGLEHYAVTRTRRGLRACCRWCHPKSPSSGVAVKSPCHHRIW